MFLRMFTSQFPFTLHNSSFRHYLKHELNTKTSAINAANPLFSLQSPPSKTSPTTTRNTIWKWKALWNEIWLEIRVNKFPALWHRQDSRRGHRQCRGRGHKSLSSFWFAAEASINFGFNWLGVIGFPSSFLRWKVNSFVASVIRWMFLINGYCLVARLLWVLSFL